MNPALLQHPYSGDYPLNADNKYLGQERSFANSTGSSANEYSLLGRKSQNVLTNPPLGQTLALTTNNGLEYNPHQLIQDHPFLSGSQLLLSPPSSVDGSTNASVHPASSSFIYSHPTKSLSSNASTTEQFSAASASFMPSAWSDSTMTDYNSRLRPSALPPTLSPPLSYSQSSGVSGQYFAPLNRSMEPYGSPYPGGRPYHGSDLSHTYVSHRPRSPTFNTPPLQTPYNSSCTYTSMPSQTPSRPEGPPFEDTKHVLPLVTGRNQSLLPEITANIQKGFFQVDGKWTCYRRNYFTVSCAFHFKNATPEGPVYLQRHSQLEPVHQYAMSISAQTANLSNQDTESRTLVQHTPKRDKATESVPGRHLVQPAPMQSIHSSGSISTSSMYPGGQHITPGMMGAYNGFASHGHHSIPTSYTFERIQFQRATANNGKRRAQQQYFHVVVELSVNVGRPNSEEVWIVVATRQSYPMVVRGRSPGHYKDNIRRDGQTNHDPDRGHGAGDGGPGSFSMPPLLGQHSSSMDWTPNHRANGHHYNGSYTRHLQGSDSSSSSVGSLTALTRTPVTDEFRLVRNKDDNVPCFDHTVLKPVLRQREAVGTPQKRPVDEENSDSDQNYYSNSSIDESFSPPSYEYGSNASTRPLCASS